MIWNDKYYIRLISNTLRNFKWTGADTAVCSCPVCGDSKKNKFKTRFYFLPDKNHYNVYCHNCGYAHHFSTFLESYYPDLHRDYKFSSIRDKQIDVVLEVKEEEPQVLNNTALKDVVNINLLPKNHMVNEYCDQRLIPYDKRNRLYYTDDFQNWVNSYDYDKFKLPKKESRLVIPLITRDNYFIGCSGRALDNTSQRYYRINIDYSNHYPPYYFYNFCDLTKDIIVCEGPIDALFLENSIAIATLNRNLNLDVDKTIICLDNQPRNRDVLNAYNKYINLGYRVFIWPKQIKQKDFNDYVLIGGDPNTLIKENIFNGLKAKLQLSNWSGI